MKVKFLPTEHSTVRVSRRNCERGAALATAVLLLAVLGTIGMTVLAVVHTETRIAGSDFKRMQAFYAAAAGIEKMTSDFGDLYARTSRPTSAQLTTIQNSPPPELINEGYTLSQQINLDNTTLTAMRQSQGITNGSYPTVTVPSGPFNGLTATIEPYTLTTTARGLDGTEVRLRRTMNNYLIPLFQFGMFGNADLELHPGPPFSFNGRIHANGNLYVGGDVTFLAKVTTANEYIYDVMRNGGTRTGNSVKMKVGSILVASTMGSMTNGPNITSATSGQRGFFPGSPNGAINSSWNTTSIAAAATGVNNQFGGQLLTGSTGATKLLLPMQLDGFPSREIIKRRMPNDATSLKDSRYHSKAQIRILIDDENPAMTDASGIPAGQGVTLSTFNPIPLPNAAKTANGARALWRINDDGTYLDTATTCMRQSQGGTPGQAMTVRGVRAATQNVTLHGTATKIPGGAGVTGRILIEVVDANGVVRDVTTQILSMGMTEGEPNAIVYLQRPLWAAFTQGARDASGGSNSLSSLVFSGYGAADGEIQTSPAPTIHSDGYLTGIVDDTPSGQPTRSDTAPTNASATLVSDWGTANWGTNGSWNAIVPVTVYNVREGSLSDSCGSVWERGLTSVVSINMRNLARWLDGVYDATLLNGTTAVSTNIAAPDGYTVYVSDRRGDKVRSMIDYSGANINSSNGMVDNEDIYGPNGLLDPGEDVQGKGVLVKDTTECPDPAVLAGAYGTNATKRAIAVAAWTNPSNYFRRAVRVVNAENLQITGAANKLSSTLGITLASENMVYIWGNFNTTGINTAPPGGTSSLNDSTKTYHYTGNQIPASIICDAFFPLSKTWFDSISALYPDDLNVRRADKSLPNATAETSCRAAIIAGNNLSALSGSPDAGNSSAGESRLNGGMHNFPRFLENWDARWNFVGSLVPLYNSTQALGQYNANSCHYSPPIRNWAFDSTFLIPNRLPPATPQFQYIQPTAFRQVLY